MNAETDSTGQEPKPTSSTRWLQWPLLLLTLVWAGSYLFVYHDHFSADQPFWEMILCVGFVEDLLHLAVPFSVLAIEFYVLRRMHVEAKERQLEIARIKDTQRALVGFQAWMGRANYLSSIALGIRTAKKSVLFTTASMEASYRSASQREVLNAVLYRVGKMKQAKDPYVHRGVVARRPAALPGTLELLCKARHIDVRMSAALCMSRLRFVVVDSERSILGIADGEPDLATEGMSEEPISEQPSTRSFVLDSVMLGGALAIRFEQLWESGTGPFAYLDEFILEAKRSKPDYCREDVDRWLNVQRCGIDPEWLAEHSKAYRELPNTDQDQLVSGKDGSQPHETANAPPNSKGAAELPDSKH
ncbi:hypothetical protein PHYC_02011 [Phycisphaerales bacterium]|nr:hypothetical protein PHYC_02011 [Phycisphaerales bacterium]